jgi:hypothetical protein
MNMLFGAPSGNRAVAVIVSALVVWGPHEVGGAQPGAERR